MTEQEKYYARKNKDAEERWMNLLFWFNFGISLMIVPNYVSTFWIGIIAVNLFTLITSLLMVWIIAFIREGYKAYKNR